MNTLTKSIAKRFLGTPGDVDLSSFTAIDDDAAKTLIKYKGDLYLNGLISITEFVADALSCHKGGKLELKGLSELSVVSFNSLRRHGGLKIKKNIEKKIYQANINRLLATFEELSACGIIVSKEIRENIDSWPYDSDRFEGDIFFDVLSILASEGFASDEDLPLGSRGFYLDLEAIYETGDYARILEGFAFIACRESELEKIVDHVDLQSNEVWIEFKFKGKKYRLDPEQDGDWVCTDTLAKMAKILKPAGCSFYGIDNGQSSSFFCFPRNIEEQILSRGHDCTDLYKL